MASIAVIQTDENKITVDKGGRASLSFTITNVSGAAINIGIRFHGKDSAINSWTKVNAPSERKLSEQGTATVSVELHVPDEAKEGQYKFSLLLYSLNNPNLDFSESDSIIIEVPEKSIVPPPPPPNPKWWLWASIGGVSLLLIIGLIWALSGPTKVPDVVGKQIEVAMSILKKADFKRGEITESVTGNVAPGIVMEQKPKAGTDLEDGAPKTIDMIVKAKPVKVPTDLIGKTFNEAKESLTQVGLRVGNIEHKKTAQGVSGTIIGISPAPGSEQKRGSAVNLVVAEKPDPRLVNVPVGLIGKTLSDASALLTQAGLNVGEVKRKESIKVSGTVIDVTPDQDTQQKEHTVVYLTVAKKPVTPSVTIKLFSNSGATAAHPVARVTVPKNYKIIGGGAQVNWSGPGNLLTASYPVSTSVWEAKAKDHDYSSPANITVYALAIYDPKNEWSVKIFNSTSAIVQHPTSQIKISTTYLLTGGGAKVNWSGAGNLLTASFPSNKQTWEARSKDHTHKSPASITAYAIGIRPRNGADLPKSRIFSDTGSVAAHPTYKRTIEAGYTLTGGGARDNWSGYGNLLTASYPLSSTEWKAAGKDHKVSSPASLTVYAIGVKN